MDSSQHSIAEEGRMFQLNRSQFQEVAERANVTPEQARKVLLQDKQISADVYQRVYRAADALGLQLLIRGKIAAGVIGVLTPTFLRGEFISNLIRGIDTTLAEHDYLTAIQLQTDDWEEALIQKLRPGGVAGIIATVPTHHHHIAELCEEFHCPLVFHDYSAADAVRVPTVSIDSYHSMRVILEYLFTLGHRRIGFITGWLEQQAARARLEAYQDTLADAGIAYDEMLVGEGNWDHTSGYQAALRMLRGSDRPTAIAASNDLMAFGVFQAANEVGLQPGQNLSVTGFDDIPLASSVTPSLTTIRQPTAELGKTAANMLLSLIRGEDLPTLSEKLAGEFIIRNSTRPVNSRVR
jgi:LacI family transcriptional regulator